MRTVLTIALAAIASSGCGLIFQGFQQDVRVAVEGGAPATVTFNGQSTAAPGTFRIRRRPNWRVARAEAPGMAPGCTLIRCPQKRALRVLGMIPLFIPFTFDAILGTLGDCPDEVLVELRPLPEGVKPYTIPGTDREIAMLYHHTRQTLNVCESPHLFAADFDEQVERILVTNGPLQQPYEVIGPVDATIAGFDATTVRTSNLTGFYWSSRAVREFSQAGPAMMNESLRREALMKYGTEVDAVINVDYMTNPKNDVSATGLAVRLVGVED
jgi:hypothetical protein